MNLLPLLLAGALDAGPYVSLPKVGVVIVFLFLWAMGAQWVDRDTDVVKAQRERWNLVVLSGGAVASFVLLVVPFWRGNLFAVGMVSWALIAGGAMLAYLVHRNARVVPAARVLTPGHIKRVFTGGRDSNKPKDRGQRVRISDHKGHDIEFPEDPEEAEAYQITQDFLFDLLWRRTSLADLMVGKDKYRLICRVDGVAKESEDGVALEDGERIIRYLKKLAGLNVEEIRRPQEGVIELALLGQEGDAGKTKVRTSGTTAGERLRLEIQADPRVLRLHELGMAPARLSAIKKVLGKPTGLLLLSAPPEQGLTTTQYAILRTHDAYMNNIHALERRPLTELDNITQQRYEGSNIDVNYARMLQTVLRREPDIVMVAECEDRETAQVASRAAAQDRKIYLGIRAKDTFDALIKYVAFTEDNELAAKALLGVLNQRLVRVLCTECREAFEPDPKTLKKLNLPVDKIEHFYRPPSEPKRDRKGREILCTHCRGSGYVGRTGVFELLVVDGDVAKLLAAGAPVNRIKAQCRKNKMYYLQEEGLLKVIDGTTSMNEILRCLRSSEK